LPYVNAKPHLGFAVEIIRADAIARYQRLTGKNVFFNTGTDEHGVKIFQKAEEEGITPQELCDRNSQFFRDLKNSLNISYDAFIRTTDEIHEKAAQEFWNVCKNAGYIEKRVYSGLYCKGCEMFKTGRDLVDGKCVEHPNMTLEEISEENYFFLYSKFSQTLLDLYDHKDFVLPEFRLNEIKNQIKDGLEDFSISRIKSKMPWGIPVPGDDEQVMYVWFDALVNYISTLGWPSNTEKFLQFWNSDDSTVVQICGKDNLQHQAARWQAMLASVNLPFSTHIIVNGFITVDGQKMSKSLGNVIDPVEIVNEYGVDALRYFAIRELSPHEDGDFNIERFKEAYNANLANGIGNLTNRIMKMAEDNVSKESISLSDEVSFDFENEMNAFNLHGASQIVWQHVSDLDKKIQVTEPFKLIKVDKEAGEKVIIELVQELHKIALMLRPLLPGTADKILAAINAHKKPETPIFNRL
jgi:methionyl-tRNA synthetase